MAGIQLYDIESKSPVDVDPDKVRAAMATGRFAFPKGQNVPVIYNGAPAWIKPEDAHKYVDNLTFTTDDAVRKANAQSEYSGVGGIADSKKAILSPSCSPHRCQPAPWQQH